MNKNKKDYSKGKIYCVRSYKTDLIYIGSTCQPLSKRLNMHKASYNYYLKNGTLKYMSSKIYELDDSPYIELIVNYPCSCLDELRREEGKYIRLMDCVNRKIEGRTQKEWYEDNKEKILKQAKEYYNHNKEKAKEYYNHNKEKLKEYQKEYNEQNKEKINKNQNQKFICSCGGKYTKQNKTQHERTNKHIEFTKL